jgi:hypothetical protein
MTKKTLIIILIALGGLFILYKLADMFSPGSYGHAETYEFEYPEEKVIEAINKLKAADKDLVVPKVTIQNSGQLDLKDGKEKETDYWYKFYFYDKEKNQILFTWTRRSGQSSTTFAFVSVNSGLNLGNWKEVNDDLGRSENKEVIRDFEETILKRVKELLNNDK